MGTTSGMNEPSGPNNRGRISTLSSMVRPAPTAATRTVSITREGGRNDAIETEDYWDLLPLLLQRQPQTLLLTYQEWILQ